MEKHKVLEFLHSLQNLKEWTEEETEIIDFLLLGVEQSETEGQLMDAILKAIQMLPQIVEFVRDLLE